MPRSCGLDVQDLWCAVAAAVVVVAAASAVDDDGLRPTDSLKPPPPPPPPEKRDSNASVVVVVVARALVLVLARRRVGMAPVGVEPNRTASQVRDESAVCVLSSVSSSAHLAPAAHAQPYQRVCEGE